MSRFLARVLDGQGASYDGVIATGHVQLDQVLAGGLRPGTVSLVAGIPGVGTSTFCLGVARRAALVDRVPTAVIAPDAPEQEILARVVSAEAKVPLNHLRGGDLTPDDVAKVERKRALLLEAPLVVTAGWHRPAETEVVVGTVEDQLRAGAKLVLVDGTPQAEPHTRELFLALKTLALRSRAVLIVASTMTMPDQRRTDRPTIEDLRDYRSTADLVDLVIGLHRPDMHDLDCTRAGEVDVEILKHRYGPTRRLALLLQGHYARFVDLG
jgi:replicative DNA helicase